MRFAIFKINANPSILHEIKLYAKIFDSCKNRLHSILGQLSFYRTMGLIDSGNSQETVRSITQGAVFNMILISHTAYSSQLSDRIMFENFFRTIPSDDSELNAIVDMIRYFHWNYVSVINSHGYYQQSAEALISKLGRQTCVATHVSIPKYAEISEYDSAIAKLRAQIKADVIIVIATTQDTKLLLRAAEADVQARTRLTFVAGTKFTAYKSFLEGAKRAATGLLSLSFSNARVTEFEEHVDSQVTNYLRYDWLRKLMPKLVNCSLSFFPKNGMPRCTGKEKLSSNLSHRFRHVPAKAVVNAVHTVACGIRKYIEKQCMPKNLTTAQCKSRLMEWYNSKDPRSEILTYYQKGMTTCPGLLPYSVSFDNTGSYPRDYNILNFDGDDFQVVGHWRRGMSRANGGSLQLNETKIRWKEKMPLSRCSSPCKSHEIKIADVIHKQCCFTCSPCSSESIVVRNACMKCPVHQRPNQKRNQCYSLPVLRVDHSDWLSVVIIFTSLTGLLATVIVAVIFVVRRNSQVIKAASREISVVILLSLAMMFVASIIFTVTATAAICAVRRIIVGLGLSSCYGASMLKMNRIYRIFQAASSGASSPVLVSGKSQILICVAFLAFQILLGITWLYAEPVSIATILTGDKQYVIYKCKENSYNFLVNLLPCSCCMLKCTYYAYKTRRFPENFNEAMSIGYTMYLNCLIWAVFIPVKLWLESNADFSSDFAVAIFSSVIGLVGILGLFGPKAYRALFKRSNSDTFRFFFSSNSTASTCVQR